MAEVGNSAGTMKGSGVQVRLGSVVNQIALLPATQREWFRWIIYDMLSHHRLSVLEHNKMPGGRGAQQMLATRTWRIVKINQSQLVEIFGEGWAAADRKSDEGADYVENRRFFHLLEFGGQVSANALMAVPILHGRDIGRKEFRRALKGVGTELDIVPRKGKPPLLVEHMRGKSNRYRARDRIFAVLTRQTTYRPMLGYYARWEDIQNRRLPDLEKGLEQAMTTAGQAALENKDRQTNAQKSAEIAKFREMIAQGFRSRDARRAATLAGKQARRAFIANRARRGGA